MTLLREDPLALDDSAPEPDLAIVRGDESDFASRHPSTAALVIEIAVTSTAEDHSLASLYAEAGVEEYLDRPAGRAPGRSLSLPGERGYLDRTLVEGEATLECGSVAGGRVALAELFG